MTKAHLIDRIKEGEYYVELPLDTTLATERSNWLAQELINLTQPLLDAQVAENQAKALLDEAVTALSDYITSVGIQAQAEHRAIRPEEIDQMKAEAKQVEMYRGEWYKARGLTARLRGRKLAVASAKTALDQRITASEPPMIRVWCADYTERLEEDFTDWPAILVPNENSGNTITLAPGYNATEGWVQAKHGWLTPPWSQEPNRLFYNYAMFPGWQRWMPYYRHGTIQAINYQTNRCTVALDTERSSVKYRGERLNVMIDRNHEPMILTNVPASYMECDSDAFEVGDRVIVAFREQHKDTPAPNWYEHAFIIGFIERPRPCCLPGFLVIPRLGEAGTAQPQQLLHRRDDGAWVASRAMSCLAGNIDWTDGEETISWQGPPGRNLPILPYSVNIGATPSIYQGGRIIAIAPAPVAGACLKWYGDTQYIYCIVVGDVAYRRKFNGNNDPYHETENPGGWQSLGSATYDVKYRNYQSAWFFNASGSEASTIRQYETTGHYHTHWRYYEEAMLNVVDEDFRLVNTARLTCTIGETTAAFSLGGESPLGNVRGDSQGATVQEFTAEIAVDYIGDTIQVLYLTISAHHVVSGTSGGGVSPDEGRFVSMGQGATNRTATTRLHGAGIDIDTMVQSVSVHGTQILSYWRDSTISTSWSLNERAAQPIYLDLRHAVVLAWRRTTTSDCSYFAREGLHWEWENTIFNYPKYFYTLGGSFGSINFSDEWVLSRAGNESIHPIRVETIAPVGGDEFGWGIAHNPIIPVEYFDALHGRTFFDSTTQLSAIDKGNHPEYWIGGYGVVLVTRIYTRLGTSIDSAGRYLFSIYTFTYDQDDQIHHHYATWFSGGDAAGILGLSGDVVFSPVWLL